MKNKNEGFNPNEKKVNVSICKSNLSKKKNEYYGRVCRKGRISSDALMGLLKKKCSYFDTSITEVAIKELIDIIVDLTSSGYSVDFFSLGTFLMQVDGKINIDEKNDSEIKDENINSENSNKGKLENRSGDFDVSSLVIGKPKFKLSFEPSRLCKKTFENVSMAVAVKKRRSPIINKVEALAPNIKDKAYSIIKVTGEDLKILGDNKECGIYIKKAGEAWVSINKESILQNHPTTLLLALNTKLKYGIVYKIRIATQYVRQGKAHTSNILRCYEGNFIWDGIEKNILRI